MATAIYNAVTGLTQAEVYDNWTDGNTPSGLAVGADAQIHKYHASNLVHTYKQSQKAKLLLHHMSCQYS